MSALTNGFEENKQKESRLSFFEKVYEVVRQIPPGRVTSYGAIATYLGSRGSSRMVGWAMNHSHSAFPLVPAQRVVNRKGLLTGRAHFAWPGQMQELLEAEGVSVSNNQVVDIEKRFWNPAEELPDLATFFHYEN